MSQKSGQMEQQTKEPKKKEGLQPLTIENVKEFHEEEESWEDPKDFGIFHVPFFNPPQSFPQYPAAPDTHVQLSGEIAQAGYFGVLHPLVEDN